ncbi:hypothetical protein SPRG_09702 [Saprolegnia parasitica CBS 223.65]|uniref:Uncharacterized protein n=1 Tax=Saprolegnia parasitica (strain CBS 223.65) TaxID=695850 RepID=A0A067CEI6_SAPPC|nr:hypothetical protein SPRG_09702 [Saprolegnia parasitica CBS 223.65]KDO24971.1 hypothetical protein SPRG_09702 [Saprolegnia parasitica CBS 223.65]|eukprot:XP_012204242.1 hypothetical protein SPRG_09702 [Saprolegnia parasitica CBS 223.65]
MLSFDSADDRIAAYLRRRAAMAHASDDEAQDEKLTPSEMEMLMLNNVDDRITAYETHRMIAANVGKTTATETTIDTDHTKSVVDTTGQGAVDQDLPPTPTYDGPRDVFCQEIPCVSVWERKSIEGTVYDLSRSNGRRGTTFTLVASWHIDVKHTNPRNVTIGLNDEQSALSFRVRFPMTCSDVRWLSLRYVIAFESVSLSAFTDYLQNRKPLPGWLQGALALKYLIQLTYLTMLLMASAFNIWSLWLRFNSITEFGIILPQKGRMAIALTDGENLHAWYTLRNGVRAATAFLTEWTTAFVRGALLQFACTATGILVYCIAGAAPLPTYFLLLIGLFGSLSTLTMLVPLAAALDIQHKHGPMLRKQLLELDFARRKALLQGDASGFDERIAMFESIIDAIENHDDRLTYFGIEISLARLATLGATLLSLLSFVAFRAVPITWSTLNTANILMSPDVYQDALNPLKNTPQTRR